LKNQFSLKSWILAARPKTLSAAIAPVILGTALAWHDFHIDIITSLVTFLSAICIQIGTNFSNDISDFLKGADTKERLGPIRATQSGLLTIKQLKIGTIIIFSIAIIFGFYLAYIGGMPIVIIGLTSIAAGILYTAGPYPIGYHGMGDIFVFMFFGIIAVSGTYFLQTGYITQETIFCGIAIGFLSTAILVVNNLRDADTDRKAGKRTLTVRLGKSFSKIEYVFFITIPFFIPIFFYLRWDKLSLWLPIFSFPLSISLAIAIFTKTGTELNIVLSQTARLLIIFTILFSLGIML